MKFLKITPFLLLLVITIQLKAQLSTYKTSSNNPKQTELSKKLKEISGLALTSDYRLFAHGDEKGTVYQLDTNSGEILKEFELGDKSVKADFEGIAIVGNKFYMVVSNGDIYEFEEGNDKEKVAYNLYQTELKSKYDVEGLCYDDETNSLLLACKEFAGKEYEQSRAVYSFDLKTKQLDAKPRFIISLQQLEQNRNVNEFKPSAIEWNPQSSTFFILGGKGLIILEITKEGKVIDELILDPGFHYQPEGIVFLSDGTMIISDEAFEDRATLTFYKNR